MAASVIASLLPLKAWNINQHNYSQLHYCPASTAAGFTRGSWTVTSSRPLLVMRLPASRVDNPPCTNEGATPSFMPAPCCVPLAMIPWQPASCLPPVLHATVRTWCRVLKQSRADYLQRVTGTLCGVRRWAPAPAFRSVAAARSQRQPPHRKRCCPGVWSCCVGV